MSRIKKHKKALLRTTFVGYGDLLYLVPTLRYLKTLHEKVHVWCNNPEPFLGLPCVDRLFKVEGTSIPHGGDFYYENIFDTNARIPGISMTNIHTVDFHSLAVCGITFQNKLKYLQAYWTPEDKETVDDLLKSKGITSCKFCVVAPTTSWPSRTLPLGYYKALIKKASELTPVLIVGKQFNSGDFGKCCEHLRENENKGMYNPKIFTTNNNRVVDLSNQLSFAQLCYLYSRAAIAINTENGNMVASCTNNTCWNFYIPMVTPPEFRLPHRKASQHYRTTVVEASDPYYATTDPAVIGSPNEIVRARVKLASIKTIVNAYEKTMASILKGDSFATR